MADKDLTGRRIAVALGVVALVVGSQVIMSDSSDDYAPVLYSDGDVIVGGLIENVLDERDGADIEGGPTAGETFETEQGVPCRTFQQGDVKGTACDLESEWRVIELRQSVPGVELPTSRAEPTVGTPAPKPAADAAPPLEAAEAAEAQERADEE